MSNLLAYSGTSDRILDAKAVSLADHLIKLKRKHQTDIWPVIDAVVAAWKKTRPVEWDALVIEIEGVRKSTYNKYGEARNTKGTGSMRRTLDIPFFFDRAVRSLYTVDELPFNKEFYEAVWKRYPIFRVSQKV